MSQPRAVSMIETCTNVGIGFLVSLAFWTWFIVPFYALPMDAGQNLEIVAWFTALAIVRGYVVRRCYNWIGREHGLRRVP